MPTRRAVTAGVLAAPAFLPSLARAQADTGLLVHLSGDYALQKDGFWQPMRFNEISAALAAAIEPAERKRLWLALLDEYEAEAPTLILYPVREHFAKRRAIQWTHYPLYCMDFRSYNLSCA